MCGIIGYAGDKDAAPTLLEGLRRMEYRGYDSAGIAIIDEASIYVKKDAGRVDEIHKRLNLLDLPGRVGIAHTRWATHGGVTQNNAHPHTSCDHKVAVVHNGIIENFQELKPALISEGHTFKSETDTEVIPHLIEKFYHIHHDERRAILEAVRLLKGAFAFLAIFQDEPDTIYAARKDTPLVIGIGRGENFVASDIISFLTHTDQVIFLDNFEVAAVKSSSVEINTFTGEKVDRRITQVAWEASDISRKEFAHYTIKEIHEQASIVKASLTQDDEKLSAFCNQLKTARKVYITGCGTSFHAGLLAKYFLARLPKLPSEVFVSSEFNHHLALVDQESVLLTISQSGETADVLAAVREARSRGAKILTIVNNLGSILVRESDLSLSINCGPELGVAATKSFTSQLMLIYLITLRISSMESEIQELKRADEYLKNTLSLERKIVELAKALNSYGDFYFVGRGLHYPIALEGALKLKELAYVHAEGFPAGELKHGTLALIEEGTPAVVLNPEDETYSETLNNAAEMKARGARIIGISNKVNPIYDVFIPIAKVGKLLYPIIEVVPLQMFAYYTALEKQRNPDFPRNLAKSVTVK